MPSWPSRCGRKRSGPLTPSISPSCEPQMPLQIHFDQHLAERQRRQLDLFEDEWGFILNEDGGKGFHLQPLFSSADPARQAQPKNADVTTRK